MSAAPMDPFTQAVMLAAKKQVALIVEDVAAKATFDLRHRLHELALNASGKTTSLGMPAGPSSPSVRRVQRGVRLSLC